MTDQEKRLSDELQLLPKNLTSYLDDILILGNVMNQRPVSQQDRMRRVWFSEVILTNNQKLNYDEAEEKLREVFARWEAICANRKNLSEGDAP